MEAARTTMPGHFRAVCWWFVLTYQMLAAFGARSANGAKLDGASAYHPGHQAAHVTRLLRYDHQGVDSLHQAEQAWSRGVGFGPQLSSTVSPSGFLSLSAAQTRALQDHHKRLGADETNLRRVANAEALVHDHRYCGRNDNNNNTASSAKAVIGLTNLYNSQYVGPVGVGSVLKGSCKSENIKDLEFIADTDMDAAQEERQKCHVEDESKIWVVFDTGSTNIWVSSDLCKFGPCIKTGRSRYNHTQSLSYAPGALSLTIQFGTGQIKGPQGIDDFHVGPFTVFKQTFGMIEEQNGEVFNDLPFEGILGLSFKSMAAGGHTPFFDNVIGQSSLKHNEFAFYFSTKHVAGNAMFWGGVDKHFYDGNIEYFPVVDPYYWSLDLDHFGIGSNVMLGTAPSEEADQNKPEKEDGYALLALNSTSRPTAVHGLAAQMSARSARTSRARTASPGDTPKAIVDTGTTYFTAERKLFKQIMKRIKADYCESVSAKTHPPLVYRLRNVLGEARTFSIPHKQYMTESGEGSQRWCTPSIMQIDIPAEHGPAMVLGEVFLRQQFAVFDRGNGSPENAKIGFAPAVHNEKAQRRLKEITKGQSSFAAATLAADM